VLRARAAAVLCALSCAAVLVVVACSPGRSGPGVVIGDGDEALPNATVQDWKSYGDAVAAIEVVGARAEPTSPEVAQSGEGLLNRVITVRVRHVYWRARHSRSVPATFTMLAWGWVIHDRKRRPTVSRGSVRLEVGHRYLVVLAHYPDGWGTLGTGAQMPFDGGVVGRGEWLGRAEGPTEAQEYPGIAALLGGDDRRIAAVLARAHADPLADALRNLPPVARYQRVYALHQAHSS
jgi:hypothetical protein